jgi:hypothetical protein
MAKLNKVARAEYETNVAALEMGLNTERDLVLASKTTLKDVAVLVLRRWVSEGGAPLNMDCLIGGDDSEVSLRDLVKELDRKL